MKISLKALAIGLIAAMSAVSSVAAETTLSVTLVAKAPPKEEVVISHARFDTGGNTSVRYQSNKDWKEAKPGMPESGGYFNRDRDLGQTFTVGEKGFWLNAITLRTGPEKGSVKKGAANAKVSLQLLKVSGNPVIDDNGTTTKGSATNATWTDDPRIDDVIKGEVLTHHMLISGGRLPENITDNKLMRWELGGDPVFLEPNTQYAFMVMLDECLPDNSFTLSNLYFGTYKGGHGLRREGKPAPEGADWKAPEYSTMNPVGVRIFESPGTKGRPDVDTWRDLYFHISGSYDKPTN